MASLFRASKGDGPPPPRPRRVVHRALQRAGRHALTGPGPAAHRALEQAGRRVSDVRRLRAQRVVRRDAAPLRARAQRAWTLPHQSRTAARSRWTIRSTRRAAVARRRFASTNRRSRGATRRPAWSRCAAGATTASLSGLRWFFSTLGRRSRQVVPAQLQRSTSNAPSQAQRVRQEPRENGRSRGWSRGPSAGCVVGATTCPCSSEPVPGSLPAHRGIVGAGGGPRGIFAQTPRAGGASARRPAGAGGSTLQGWRSQASMRCPRSERGSPGSRRRASPSRAQRVSTTAHVRER